MVNHKLVLCYDSVCCIPNQIGIETKVNPNELNPNRTASNETALNRIANIVSEKCGKCSVYTYIDC